LTRRFTARKPTFRIEERAGSRGMKFRRMKSLKDGDRKAGRPAGKLDGGRVAFLILFSLCGQLLFGGDDSVSGSASICILNRYIFRGYRIGAGSVVVQPALSVSYLGFSASFWGNIDTDEKATPCFVPDRPGQKSFNETDLVLSYSRSLGKFELTAGFIYYGTKYTAETEEIYAAASYNIFGKPTLTVYRDIGAYPGTYFLLAIGQSFPLARNVTLDVGASAAYFSGDSDYWRTYLPSAGNYTGKIYRALHDGTAKVGLTFPLGKSLGLQAVAQYVFPLSEAAARTFDDHSYNINGPLADVWVLGAILTWGF
jgi:hypothetical protein